MRTSDQYVSNLYSMRNNVHLGGEFVGRDHPDLLPGINVISLTFDLAQDPNYADLVTVHVEGEKINRFNHIPRNTEDLINKITMVRRCCQKVGGCIQRCMGNDSLTALSAVTYTMDEKLGTEYHKRFLKYFDYFKKNDLVGSAAMTDVKGDRSLRPHQQADRDLYLRFIEKNNEGIVVRGAKAHNSISPYSDELIVMPTRALTKNDQEYAVSFAIPADAEGVVLVSRSVFNRQKKKFDLPVDKFGESGSITIFDDVLIPWERVFMCGEWQFAGALTSAFSRSHRHTYCGCKPATTDILLGAASLIAEYNGVERASHIGGKLAELIATSELIFACGIASATQGEKTLAGTFLPDRIFSNVGRFYAGRQFHHECEIIHDIAGGLATTMPEDEDLSDPKIWTFMEKYLKGKANVPVEYRIRCLRLIEDLTVSHLGGHKLVGGIHGGGSPEMEKIAIIQEYNLEEKKDIVKELAGIPKDGR